MAFPEQRVFRFAPSPNGFLHLGHAYSALLNFGLARACDGRFLLRIEDIDRGRARPEFEAAIFEDLAWIGLEWEKPVRRQSEHFEDYASALERLDAMGLLYACDCTRADIAKFAAAHADWPCDPDGAPLYPGTCRDKPRRPARETLTRGGVALRLDMAKAAARAGQGVSWREFRESRDAIPSVPLEERAGWGEAPGGTPPAAASRRRPPRKGEGLLTPGARLSKKGALLSDDAEFVVISADPKLWGDVVIARKDTPASYHIAVVVDDALQGVTDIVRGRDLFHATSLHRLLQRLLDLPEPRYRHHQLVVDEGGEKLAKSRGSTTLRALWREGVGVADIVRRFSNQF
ncbi:glutamyl-Q tRNA(Asp) synthetase [Methylocystis parvus]|uniref:Glutamyl-Q tRNA(Asp) synthetase n=1 Tax=Methylocystis parvus TaxID=134 RepID=A0A6B8M2Y6_9HYPH|nr:glutamyl-Q tRNA(Asp) synthetase [Methylocystis parvus]QGM96139.1 glutamyl-Q tRNA(Asp) synthetase [Methylocystis parvus]WBK00039.1 glutamyl-Q tRNA(Asp) synthetase [Methylocystis parvus OBBP]